MTRNNPPVFDHIVGLGGGNWIPFEDTYTIARPAITGVGQFITFVAATRNYLLCKEVACAVDEFNVVYNRSPAPVHTVGTTSWIVTAGVLDAPLRVYLDLWCLVFGVAPTVQNLTVRVSGWAPAP